MVDLAWESVAPLPLPLISPSVRTFGGRLFVLGSANYPRRHYSYDPSTDTWTERKRMPSPGVIHPFVSRTANRMYVAGGINPETGKAVRDTWRYSETNDTWTKMKPMPAARHTNGATIACGARGKLYVFGGLANPEVDGSTGRSEVYVYNYKKNKWSSRRSMPANRYGHAIGHSGTKFYIVGGMEKGKPASNMARYDFKRNKWTQLAGAPLTSNVTVAAMGRDKIVITCAGDTLAENILTNVYDFENELWMEMTTTGHDGRTKAGSERAGNYYYMIGGVLPDGSATDSVMRINIPDIPDDDLRAGQIWPRCDDLLDLGHWEAGTPEPSPADTTWRVKTPMPVVRRDHAAVRISGKTYIFGGRDSGATAYNTVYVYDSVADTWSTKTAMSTTAYNFIGAGVINGSIYLAGGYRNGALSFALTKYSPSTDTWNILANMPVAVTQGADVSSVVDGKLYAVAGYNTGVARNSVYAYDPATNLWATKTTLPVQLDWPSTCELFGQLYVVGGMVNTTTPNQKLYRYDPVSNTWATLADLPAARKTVQLVAAGGKIYALGGQDAASSVSTAYVYDVADDRWSQNVAMTLPQTRSGGTATLLDDTTIALIGGVIGSGGTDNFIKFNIGGLSAPILTDVDPIPADNPLVYWKMEDAVGSTTASDSSGNNHPAVQNPQFSSSYPVYNQAGVGGTKAAQVPSSVGIYAALPSDTANTWGEFTFESWIRSDTNPPNVMLMCLSGRIAGYVTTNHGRLTWTSGGFSFYMNNQLVAQATFANDAKWHHFAMVRSLSAGTVKLYIDGVLVQTATGKTQTIVANELQSGVYTSGGSGGASSAYYVERSAFYDKLLTDSQIAKHAQLFVPEGDPVPTDVDDVWVSDAIKGQVWPRSGPDFEVGHVEYIEEPPVIDETYGPGWASIAPIPEPRTFAIYESINGIIYVAGGSSSIQGGPWYSTLYAYDPSTDAWETKASAPDVIGGVCGAGVIDGKLYLAGGTAAGGGRSSQLRVYDPLADAWSTRAPAPVSPWGGSSIHTVINGILYVVGGFNLSGQKTTAAYAYNPVTDTWTAIAPTTVGVGYHSAATVNGKLYIGSSDPSVTDIYEYNPTTDTWTTKAKGFTYLQGLVGVGKRLYVVGTTGASDGAPGGSYGTRVWDQDTNTWVTLTLTPDLPKKNSMGGLTRIGRRLYSISGTEGFGPYTDCSWLDVPDSIIADPNNPAPPAPGENDEIWVSDGKAGMIWP